MADVVLSDGREVVFDLSKVTRAQWLSFVSGGLEQAEDDKTLALVSGLTAGAVAALTMLDWKKLSVAFIKKVASPLSDPN